MISLVDPATQQERVPTEIEAGMARVLAHGLYVLGPAVAELEGHQASYSGAAHCITVMQVADALHAACAR